MRRRQGTESVRAEVEAQAAACRALARGIRDFAEGMSVLKRAEARVMRGWAQTIDDIAEALIEAIDPRSPDAHMLRRLWSTARTLAVPLVFVAGGLADGALEEAGAGLFHLLADAPAVSDLAHEIVLRADTMAVHVHSWTPDTRESDPKSSDAVSQPGTTAAGPGNSDVGGLHENEEVEPDQSASVSGQASQRYEASASIDGVGWVKGTLAAHPGPALLAILTKPNLDLRLPITVELEEVAGTLLRLGDESSTFITESTLSRRDERVDETVLRLKEVLAPRPGYDYRLRVLVKDQSGILGEATLIFQPSSAGGPGLTN